MSDHIENKLKKEHGERVFNMQIIQYADGFITCKNFPSHFATALDLLEGGNRAIIGTFIKAAKEGRLNDQNVLDGGKIVVVKPNISLN